MKIALFSDIHANLPAFEAFLADLDNQKPDAVYCLGDLIGYHIWPNEVIDEIRRRSIPTIAGNHDLKLAKLGSPVVPEIKNYAYELVTPPNREYLLTLPAHIHLEFNTSASKSKILLVHGSPREVDEYVLEETPESYVVELMGDADFLCVGHSHKPYHRSINTADGLKKQVINIGSVGKPKDFNPQGGYVILHIHAGLPSIEVEFRRFDYDIDQSATAIENSPLPNELADRLRKAY